MTHSALTPSVILVSDRTLSARYQILFEGIFATMQTTAVPEVLMRRFLSPPVPTDVRGRADISPLGLRRIESSLLATLDLDPDDVVCTTPERLPDLLGPWVKAVLFSSSDPLGHGMSNTTTSMFWSGELYTRRWTREILLRLKEAKERYSFKVVLGGAGAWQCASYPDEAAGLGIDVIFEGYFEEAGPEFIRDILEERPVDAHITASGTGIDHVHPIHGASMLGIIELSRGCGRGCRFCSMSRNPMKHLPPDLILADLETNLSAGVRSVVSGSEDFFRYGSTTGRPDFKALSGLLTQMRRLDGLSFMQIDHGNVTSVLQLSEKELMEIRRLLTWEKPSRYLWVNMGVESANGKLVASNCPGKIAPFSPGDWHDMVLEAVNRLTQTGFFPVISIVLGLPGEQPSDVSDTLRMVKELARREVVIFPIFYEPVLAEDIESFGGISLKNMRADHLALYRACYEINFKRVPKLMWDNQTAGSVPWLKRMALQVMGRLEIMKWRLTFSKTSKLLKPPAEIGAGGALEGRP